MAGQKKSSSQLLSTSCGWQRIPNSIRVSSTPLDFHQDVHRHCVRHFFIGNCILGSWTAPYAYWPFQYALVCVCVCVFEWQSAAAAELCKSRVTWRTTAENRRVSVTFALSALKQKPTNVGLAIVQKMSSS